MGDLQATLELFVELNKFYNVDLFQRGWVQSATNKLHTSTIKGLSILLVWCPMEMVEKGCNLTGVANPRRSSFHSYPTGKANPPPSTLWNVSRRKRCTKLTTTPDVFSSVIDWSAPWTEALSPYLNGLEHDHPSLHKRLGKNGGGGGRISYMNNSFLDGTKNENKRKIYPWPINQMTDVVWWRWPTLLMSLKRFYCFFFVFFFSLFM